MKKSRNGFGSLPRSEISANTDRREAGRAAAALSGARGATGRQTVLMIRQSSSDLSTPIVWELVLSSVENSISRPQASANDAARFRTCDPTGLT